MSHEGTEILYMNVYMIFFRIFIMSYISTLSGLDADFIIGLGFITETSFEDILLVQIRLRNFDVEISYLEQFSLLNHVEKE